MASEQSSLFGTPPAKITRAGTGLASQCRAIFSLQSELWALKSLVCAFVAAILFSCVPIVFTSSSVTLPPAYQLKSEHPFADTSTLTIPAAPGERSHGAKLTPRLMGSVMLWAARQCGLHPFWPSTLFGMGFLLSGIVVAARLTGDRLSGFLTGLLFAGLYATNDCFTPNFGIKPFDGICLGLIALALVWIKRPALMLLCAFLSCWTDERALLGLGLVGTTVLVWPSLAGRGRLLRVAGLAAAALAYAATRLVVARILHWHAPDLDRVGVQFWQAISLVQLSTWAALEGGWILLVCALMTSLQRRQLALTGLLVTATGLAVTATLLVDDMCRVAAYAYPLVFTALAILVQNGISRRELRVLTGLAAGISLLASNYDIALGLPVMWLHTGLWVFALH